MSYEEFLDWDSGEARAEWINGEVIFLSPVNTVHQKIVDFLLASFMHFVESEHLGEVISGPAQMKTGPDLPGREPDLYFIARKNLARLKKKHLQGPADLAVEVISPDSRARDRGEKFYEYEQGGVREYWMIDYERKQAEFFVLDKKGIYRSAPVEKDGIYRSAVLKGLWIKVDWLWQKRLPTLMSVLKAWGLV